MSIVKNVFYGLIRVLCKTKLIYFFNKDVRNLYIKKYEINTKNKIEGDILFLSDLHMDIIDNSDLILKLIKGRRYDFIILGGDIIDNNKNYEKKESDIISFIGKLKNHSNYIISVLGNHEKDEIINLLRKETILLVNEKLKISNFCIYGVGDYVNDNKINDFRKINKDYFNLLVSHTPDFIDKIMNKYDLMLSGHTHGGQVLLLKKAIVTNCKYKNLVYGKWEKNGIIGITTSGTGSSGFPIRKDIKPEIVEIKIIKEH